MRNSIDPMTAIGNEPIFILGCQRSGTSLLRRIIDSHSRIACPPESGFLVQLAKVFEVQRSIECLETMGYDKTNVLERMSLFARYFFEEYARRKGKPRWADKTPHYINHVETIDLMFNGNVKYIGLIRNGMDVAFSLCEYDWGILRPYIDDGLSKAEAAMEFWRDQNEKLISFSKQVMDRFYFLKFEELTENPKEALSPLFRFLGEPWEEGVLDYHRFEHDPGVEDPKIGRRQKIEINSGNYRNWPRELQERLYSAGQPMMANFEYSL